MAFIRTRMGTAVAALTAFAFSAGPAVAGGGWGWNDWGRYRHRDRVDAGDVVTGILILGGIAAIASAASSGNRDRRRDRDRDYERSRDWQRDPAGPQGYGARQPSWNESGIGGAVDRCLGELSDRDGRDEVDTVARAGDGWRVQGRTGAGRPFSCTVDGSGRIRNLSVDGQAY